MEAKVTETSLLAHRENKKNDIYSAHERAILKALYDIKDHNGNISEISQSIKIQSQKGGINLDSVQVCRRLSKMEEKGIVHKTIGLTRPGASGKQQQVWELDKSIIGFFYALGEREVE